MHHASCDGSIYILPTHDGMILISQKKRTVGVTTKHLEIYCILMVIDHSKLFIGLINGSLQGSYDSFHHL
jgi:hypothetical protein